MKFVKDTGLAEAIRKSFPIYSAADIAKGAAMMRGATYGTDGGCMILGATAVADFIGLLQDAYDFSTLGSSNVGSGTQVLREVEINPGALIEAEYDQSDTAATTSAGSSTTFTATSLEDDIDSGWIYIIAGDAIGQLRRIITSAGGSCTVKTAFSPQTASGDTFIKILPLFHQLAKLTTDALRIGTDVGAGSGVVSVYENRIHTTFLSNEELDAGVHSGLAGLNGRSVTFYSIIRFRNHFLNTID